jgi:hypothetical protein
VKAPVLQPRQQQDLDAGKSLLAATRADSQPVIYLLRKISTSRGVHGTLIGQVYDEYLWGTPEQNPLIPTMQMHIVDRSGQVLFRSIKGDVSIPPKVARILGSDSTGTFEWDVADESYLAAYSPITAPEGIARLSWTLVLSEGRAAAVAPMAQFRRTFPGWRSRRWEQRCCSRWASFVATLRRSTRCRRAHSASPTSNSTNR